MSARRDLRGEGAAAPGLLARLLGPARDLRAGEAEASEDWRRPNSDFALGLDFLDVTVSADGEVIRLRPGGREGDVDLDIGAALLSLLFGLLALSQAFRPHPEGLGATDLLCLLLAPFLLTFAAARAQAVLARVLRRQPWLELRRDRLVVHQHFGTEEIPWSACAALRVECTPGRNPWSSRVFPTLSIDAHGAEGAAPADALRAPLQLMTRRRGEAAALERSLQRFVAAAPADPAAAAARRAAWREGWKARRRRRLLPLARLWLGLTLVYLLALGARLWEGG